MEYRKLLVDAKQQKRRSELASELPVERMISRPGRSPTVIGERY